MTSNSTTVRDLISQLESYPPDMLVVMVEPGCGCCSDGSVAPSVLHVNLDENHQTTATQLPGREDALSVRGLLIGLANDYPSDGDDDKWGYRW